jgi:hypothetical protein
MHVMSSNSHCTRPLNVLLTAAVITFVVAAHGADIWDVWSASHQTDYPVWRLAAEQVLPEGAARSSLLAKIDAYDKEARDTMETAAKNPPQDDAAAVAKLEHDGQKLREDVAQSIPLVQQDAFNTRVFLLTGQLLELQQLATQSAKEFIASVSAQAHLTEAQQNKAMVVLSPLEKSLRAVTTQPATQPADPRATDTTAEVIEVYRKFRAVLTPEQQNLYDRGTVQK